MEREESTKLELRDVFKPIKRNFGIILILVVTIVGTSTFLTWTADKIYEASALLSIQEASGAQNKLLEIPSVLHQKYVVQNQVAVLESRTLAASVIKHLLNSSYRDSLKILQRRGPKNRIPFISRILKQKKRENLPPLSFRKMVERFRKATKVSYGQETNIIELKARSSIPWEAAVLVNTWVKVYQEYTRSGTKDEVTQTRNFLEKKLKEYEQKLTRSEQELASYQRKNKVVALPQESEQIVKQLANFHYSYNSTITELQSVQEQLEYLKNQLDENRKNLVKDMSSMSSPVLGKLQEEMASLVSKKAAFEAQLIGAGIDPSTNNKLKEMESRIQGIRQKIISETKKLVESGLDNINPLGRSEDLITKILSLETDYKALKAKANAQKRVVDEYTKQLNQLPDKKLELAKLERNVQVNNKIYFMLREKAEEARIKQAGQVSIARVVDLAQPSNDPISPRPLVNFVVSLFFSLLLGFGIAYAKEFFEDTVRGQDDIDRLGLKLLGSIPAAKSEKGIFKKKDDDWGITRARQILPYFLVQQDSYSPIAESYKSLRTTLFAIEKQNRRSILLTSPGPSEGKSTTVANLAITIAQKGVKTLLVDSDLRRPVLDILFLGSHKQVGLSNYLNGGTSIKDMVRPTTVHGLDLMPAGVAVKNAAEILSSRQMVKFIQEAEKEYSIVILDSPPVLPVSDASILASIVDGVVLILRTDKTTRQSIKESVTTLNSVNANIMGCVLTGTEKRKYYRYHDYYSKG